MGRKRRQPAEALLTSTLDKLPVELIEKILDEADLSRRTLFDLATSCGRRLHPIFLAHYIRLNGGGLNPRDKCVAELDGRCRDDLIAALNFASFITSIRHFECHFPRGNLEHGILLKHFARVERLLGRLEEMEVVIFDFDPMQARLRSEEKATPSQEAKEWCERLGTLLDTVLMKGCRSLEIRGLRHYTGVYHFIDPPPARFKLMWSSSNKSKHDRTSMGVGKPVTVLLSKAARHQCKLTHFTIASESMVSPCLLQWTSSILMSCSVTHVTIEGFGMTGAQWIQLGDNFTRSSPTVQHLRLGLQCIDPEPTRKALKSMKKLEVLTLVFLHQQDFSYVDLVLTEVGMSKIRQLLQNLQVCKPPVVRSNAAIAGAQIGSSTALRIELEMEIPQPSVVEWMIRAAQRLREYSQLKSWTSIITGLTLIAQYPLLRDTGTTETEIDTYMKIWFTKIFPNVRRIAWKACAEDHQGRVKQSLEEVLEWKSFGGYLDKMDYVEVNGRVVKDAAS